MGPRASGDLRSCLPHHLLHQEIQNVSIPPSSDAYMGIPLLKSLLLILTKRVLPLQSRQIMDRAILIVIRSFLATSLILSLLSCGGGGEGGTPSLARPAQTIVSGSVQAPAGQVAFFRERSLGDLLISDAYAALTGLANVSDNTIVKLVRLNTTATDFTVLSTTTTSGGRYSFNLTALGVQPAHDLIVRVAGPGGKELRAFVVGTAIDLSPVSEAAYRLAIQSLAGGPLSNLTLLEISDIGGAVGLIATLQNIGNATAIDQAVALVRTAVHANAQVSAFIAAAGGIGQTTQGAGDVGNYFPLSQGNSWNYQGKKSESGLPTEIYVNTVNVNGTLAIAGSVATILTSSDSGGDHISEDEYVAKDASSVVYLGNNDRDDSISPALVPYMSLHFPLHVNSMFQQVNENGLSLDVDGDGINETMNISSTVSVIGFEHITVAAGSFANTAKVRTEITLAASNGISIVGTQTLWLAPGVGVIKNQTTATSSGFTITSVEELTSYQGNGTVQGALPGVIVNTGPTSGIEVIPGKASIAANGDDFLITGCTALGSNPGIFGVFVTGLGKVSSQFSLATGDCLPEIVAKPSIAFGGSNYLVAYHQTLPFRVNQLIRGNRVSAGGVVLDGSDGFLVSDATIADRCCVAVGFDGTNYLVVWSERGASDTKIYGARIAPNGQNLGVFPITSAIPGQQFGPKVAFDGTNYLVIWSEISAVTGEDISGARIAPTGTVLDPEGFRIATTTFHDRNPEIAFDGSNYLVVWENVEPLGTFANYRIRGTRISKAGVLLDGPASDGGIPINMTTHEKRTPSVTFDGSQFIVAWTVGQNSFAPPGSIVGTKVGANGQVTPVQPNPGGFLFSNQPPSLTKYLVPSLYSHGGKTIVTWASRHENTGISQIMGTIFPLPIMEP